MNFNSRQDEELRQLWQSQESQNLSEEVQRIMELVEVKAKTFKRTIFWRNVREYVAAAIVMPLFAVWAYHAQGLLQKAGLALISVSALWIVVFMWWRQRSLSEPDPERAPKEYQKALLAKYDRQISLLRTAGLWYVLPFTAGLLIAHYGGHRGRASWYPLVIVAFGVMIWLLNLSAAKKLKGERKNIEQILNMD